MIDQDELTRLRKAFAAPAGTAPAPEGCPPADRIWEAVRGELRADLLREVLDHIASCSACAEDWRIAMAFEEESRAAQPMADPITHREARILRVPRWATAAAAAFLLGIGLGVVGTGRIIHPPQTAGSRGSSSSAIEQTLSREHFEVSWTPVAGAATYDVTASTQDLDILVQKTGLTTPSYQVPAEKLTGFSSGTEVDILIDAFNADGGKVDTTTLTYALQ